MLKWLRKYNTIILVVGGILLMIAWLLPETIQQIGRTPFGAAPLRIAGSRVSYEKYDFARREHAALNMVLPGSAGDSTDHWLMLVHEAREGGFLTGKNDGPDFLDKTARDFARFQLQRQNPFAPPDPTQVDMLARQYSDQFMAKSVPMAMREARLSEDDMFRALGKLHGVLRMRGLYNNGPRFSDRRLALSLKSTDDAATVDYLFIPPDRDMASIAAPDAPTLQAFYDKYKAVKPGEGEYGVGYLLPDRVKLAWMYVDRNAVMQSIVPDPVEVRKRFVKANPTGQLPAGQTEQAAMAGFENAVRTEQTERVMRSIDVAIKAEFEKATRKLDADGDYKKLPAEWVKPDFEKLRALVPQRVKEATGAIVPPPKVEIRAASWLTKDDVRRLEGIGSAFLARGNNTENFPDTVFKVRELAGNNEAVLQVGVPSIDHPSATDGGRYYFMVLDARKESAPDSLDEIRDKVVTDYKRVQAYEALKGKLPALRETAVSLGIDTLAKSPSPDGKGDLTVTTGVRVDGNGVGSGDEKVNTEDFRKAVLAAAAAMDPLADISKLDLGQRTVAVPLPKSQGVVVARINAVAPVTIERFRAGQGQAMQTVVNKVIEKLDTDPYSLDRLEERLSVEYLDGRLKEDRAGKKKAAKPGA